ncbi:ICAM1 protein, partial [Podargus strigoides]|nr:ICAM1 protein [Podargus strigoides]
FELWVEPPVPVVAHGGSLRLTLRTTCSDPSALGDVETSFLKRLVTAAPGVTVVELLNVTEWDASVLCFYNCGLRRKLVATQLVVYSEAPWGEGGLVTLEPVPPLAVGESHELRCSVAGAAPARNLTVTLRLGGEVAHVETFPRGGGRGTPAGTVTVTWRVRARRRDAGRNATGTERPRPGVPSDNQFIPMSLSPVTEFPADPELEPHVYAEAGEAVTVTCAVGDVFPAARFELALANRTLPVTVSRDGHRATAEVTPSQAGDVGLVCTVTVGPARRRKEATVHVYSE